MLQNRPDKVPVKVHARIHALVSEHCQHLGRTVSEWVEDAITEKLDREWPDHRTHQPGDTP